MRQALGALTTRGRCFVAAGLSAALSALVLGEDDLLQVAAFLVALPLVAVAVVARTQFRLSCERVISPARVPAGEPATVRVELSNIGRIRTGLLLVEDTLPYTLGSRPRFVVDPIPAGWTSTVDYPARAELRGRYRIGPMRLRLADPFGLVELTRGFTSTHTLTVVPRVHPLPQVGIGGAWSTGGDSTSRSVAIQGDADAATREFREGDDLRKVHWRSTARVGKLMVRREEQPWQTRAAMIVDTRLSRHYGEGSASSFEWAISAAASIGVHLGRLGFSLRLFTDVNELHTGADADFSASHLLLDQLAVLHHSSNDTMERGVQALRQSNEDGLLVAVFGDVSPEEAQLVAAGRTGSARSVAVLCDVAGWRDGGGERTTRGTARSAVVARHEATADLLRRCGWRVVVGRRDETIADAWPQVGVSSFAGSGFGAARRMAAATGAAEARGGAVRAKVAR